MTVANMIYQQVETMPESLAQEVLDFARFINLKNMRTISTPTKIAASSSLKELIEQSPIGNRNSAEIDEKFQSLRDEWETK